MSRCEDYPACGHTDGLPCDWKSPNDDPTLWFCTECSSYFDSDPDFPGSPWHKVGQACPLAEVDDEPDWKKCRKCGVQLNDDNWDDAPWIEFHQDDWCVKCWDAEAKTVECVECFQTITGHDGIDFREGIPFGSDEGNGEYMCTRCCQRSEWQRDMERAHGWTSG